MPRPTTDALLREALDSHWQDQQAVLGYVQQHTDAHLGDIFSALRKMRREGYAESEQTHGGMMWRRARPTERAV